MDLQIWLEELGLEKYIDLFAQQEVPTVEVLALLSEAELESLGLPIGPRKMILNALSKRQPSYETEQDVVSLLESPPVTQAPPPESPPVAQAPPPESPPIPPAPPHETAPVAQGPPPESPPIQNSSTSQDLPPQQSQIAPRPAPQLSGSRERSRTEAKGKNSNKVTAILIAVGVHGALILLAKILIIFVGSRDEPEIIASIVPSATATLEMQKKSVQKLIKRAPSSTSAAAAPVAKLMKANAKAVIAIPDITRTSTGPLGMGDADFGSGAFGSGNGMGAGAGDGATMFGSTGSGSLSGYLYDIKRDGQGKPRKITGMENIHQGYKDFMPHLHELIRGRFSESSLSNHTKVGRPLSFTFLAIPTQDAAVGPEAFGAKGKMKPSGWLAIYRGRIRSKDFSKEIRLVGRFDDVLLVYHNGKLVLDGSWIIGKGAPTATGFRPGSEIPGNPLFRMPANIGPWFKLGAGDELLIVVGEIPGGHLGGGLFCQERGVKYTQGQFAPFVIGKLTEEDKKRLKAVPGCTLEKIPEFY